MIEFLRDIRIATRNLFRRPAFGAVIIGTWALGIGGNTAILLAAYTVLFSPLPFPHSDQLVRIFSTSTAPGGTENSFNLRGAEIQELWNQKDSGGPFSALLAETTNNRTLAGDGEAPMPLTVASVYGDWNATLGIQPILGRWFSSDEEKRGDQSGVVIISSSLWHRRFGGEKNAIGRTLILDHQSNVIVGVMPDGYHLPHAAEAWTPATMVADSIDDYGVIGRLRPGVTLPAAADAVKIISSALMQHFPNRFTVPIRFRMIPIRESFVDDQVRPAITLTATGGFFLLLATFNVAGLLIARSVSRRGEEQIRIALGATRWHLVRRSVAETLVYSAASGLLGLLVAAQAAPYLARLIPAVLVRDLGMAAGSDGNLSLSLAVATVLSLLTSAAAGLVPALAGASASSEGAGRGVGRTGRSRRERFWMDCFVTLEFIIALALIAGAGLMLRNFDRLAHRDLGIDSTRLLTIRVSTADPRFRSVDVRRKLAEDLVASAQSTPGVTAAAICTVNPLGGGTWTAPIAVENQELSDPARSQQVNHRLITPNFFGTMGIHLLQGRTFTDADNATAPGVAIVSRRMADKFWPGGLALGKRLRVNRPNQLWLTVVGVVSDVRDVTDPTGPFETWYLPYVQNAQSSAAADVVLMVRSAIDPRAVERQVEESIHRSNKDLALYDTAALDGYYLDTLAGPRSGSILIGALAAFGLLLGSLGIYGTLAFSVAERVREIGIRLALGSGRGEIVALIMKQGLRLLAAATVIGLVAAWAMGRLLSSQLSEVRPNDPLTLFTASGLLLAVASVGIYLPARRAAALDPIQALRRE